MSTPTPFDPAQHEAHPDGDVSTLAVIVDRLTDAVSVLDALDEDVALLRQATDGPRRAELAHAGQSVVDAWASARVALTCLLAVQALTPTEPTVCTVSTVDRNDLWWHCQRTKGHAGQHVSGDRVWQP